jgi:hypothetical protein
MLDEADQHAGQDPQQHEPGEHARPCHHLVLPVSPDADAPGSPYTPMWYNVS